MLHGFKSFVKKFKGCCVTFVFATALAFQKICFSAAMASAMGPVMTRRRGRAVIIPGRGLHNHRLLNHYRCRCHYHGRRSNRLRLNHHWRRSNYRLLDYHRCRCHHRGGLNHHRWCGGDHGFDQMHDTGCQMQTVVVMVPVMACHSFGDCEQHYCCAQRSNNQLFHNHTLSSGLLLLFSIMDGRFIYNND